MKRLAFSLATFFMVTNAFAQQNVLVNSPALDIGIHDTQSETSIVLLPNNRIAVGYNNSTLKVGGSAANGACNFGGSWVIPNFAGFSLSTDGGSSFKQGTTSPNAPIGMPWTMSYFGTDLCNLGGNLTDPSLAYDSTNNLLYYTSLLFIGDGFSFFYSQDQGNSFLGPIVVQNVCSTAIDNDEPKIAVDNFPGPGQGNVYATYSSSGSDTSCNGIVVAKSTNHGIQWEQGPPVFTTEVSTGFYAKCPTVVVAPNHTVFLFWWTNSTGIFSPSAIGVSYSRDLGVTWSVPQVAAPQLSPYPFGGDQLNIVGGTFRNDLCPRAVANPFFGTPQSLAPYLSYVYLAWADIGSSYQSTTGDLADIYVALMLLNQNGLTVYGGQKVNDDGGPASFSWSPTISIPPNGNSLFFSWYNSTSVNSMQAKGRFASLTQYPYGLQPGFLAPSFPLDPSGATFPAVAGADWPDTTFQGVADNYMGDYDGSAMDNSYAYVTWGSNLLGDSDTTCTNGNPYGTQTNPCHEPDVRFSKILIPPQYGGGATVTSILQSFFVWHK